MNANNLEWAEQVARQQAAIVVGPGSFSNLRVTSGDDGMGNPIYLMLFVTDDDRAYDPERRITLTQRIRDNLRDHDDEHFPIVQMMGQEDWARLEGIAVG